MLLCEVVLGEAYEQMAASAIEVLPEPYQCTLGLGRTTPDESGMIRMNNGVQVPLGPLALRQVSYGGLAYDEYVVYKPDQVRLRYLVHFQWETKLS